MADLELITGSNLVGTRRSAGLSPFRIFSSGVDGLCSQRVMHTLRVRLSAFRLSLISARFGNFPPHAPGSSLEYKWAVFAISEQAFTDPGFKLSTSLVRKRHDIGSAGAGAF